MKTEGRYKVMQKTLQKHSCIDVRTLDPNRYTETLLSSAREAGICDDETVMAIQSDLFSLLSERLIKLTNGESCSVPAETAQAVLSSVLYTLDQALLAIPSPDDAAVNLTQTPAATLYEEGLRRIKRKLQASELQYRRHLSMFRSLPDSVMKDTAVHGIAGFFRAYHAETYADVVPITADYPLYLDDHEIRQLRGVTFLGRYLQGLITETRFLAKFRGDTLHAVLSAADPLYRENPSNLFAPIFATVIGMALLRRPFSAWKFGLQRDDISAIVQMYHDGSLHASHLKQAAEVVIDLLMLDDGTADYVRRSLPKLCDSMDVCLRNQLPTRVFPCTDISYRQSTRAESTITYHGGRMDADSFRCLDFDLRTCEAPAEKTALILSRVCGLEDICDLLTSDTGALDPAEKQHLWASLPSEARQVLKQMHGDDLIDHNDGDGYL